MKLLLKLLLAIVIFLGGFILIGGVCSAVAVYYRKIYYDYIADIASAAPISIGFLMVYFGKTKWDKLDG